MSPSIEIDPDVLFVDEGDVLTSAGSAAGLDLCLHLVRSDFSADIANAVARRLVVPGIREGGQRQLGQPLSSRNRLRLPFRIPTKRCCTLWHPIWFVSCYWWRFHLSRWRLFPGDRVKKAATGAALFNGQTIKLLG